MIASANTDLPADFSAGKLGRVNIRVTQVRTQKSLQTGKVSGGDALCRYGQNVGRSPGAADSAAVVQFGVPSFIHTAALARWLKTRSHTLPTVSTVFHVENATENR